MSYFGAGYFGQGYYGPNYWGPSGGAPAPSATPGRIRESYDYYRRQQERQEQEARAETLPPIAEPSSDRLAEYSEKSRKVADRIGVLRDQTRALKDEAAQLQAQIQAERKKKARQALEFRLRDAEQAIVLAAAQEQALLEELTMIDIAYVSVIAIGVMIQ